jgi:hypothetical protein
MGEKVFKITKKQLFFGCDIMKTCISKFDIVAECPTLSYYL